MGLGLGWVGWCRKALKVPELKAILQKVRSFTGVVMWFHWWEGM